MKNSILRSAPSRALAIPILLVASASSSYSQTLVERIQLDPASTGRFGSDGQGVAISGNRVVCTSWGRVDPMSGYQTGNSPGMAFVMDATTGQQLFELFPSNGMPRDHFGGSVAMDGQHVLIGSMLADGLVPGSGAAYLYDLQTGQELFRLQASDGYGFQLFGNKVALSGNLAIVGASNGNATSNPGSAYIYDLSTGQELHKLLPPGTGFDNGFGLSVAIGGGFALVGSDRLDPLGPSVRVFDTSTGQLVRTLMPNVQSPPWELFGASLALVGTTAVVGAPAPGNGTPHPGSVYLFDVTTGQQLNKLFPSPHAIVPSFGRRVAAGDDRIVVAATQDAILGQFIGSAYVFQTSTGQMLYRLGTSTGIQAFSFGQSIAYDSGQFVVGAPYGNCSSLASGGVYLYDDFVPNSGSAYCFGDGSGAACPCGFTGHAGAGCPHTYSSSDGAMLDGVGHAQLGASSLSLRAFLLPYQATGIFFQGSTQLSSPLGEGILCTSVDRRFGVQQTNGLGVVSMTDLEVHATPGASLNYQFWFRDPIGICGPSGFNFTNAWNVIW